MSKADYRTDLLARKDIYDRIVRVWSAHLDSYELHAVMVLAATSMSFGYESIKMSHKGMITGVPHSTRPNEWFIPRMNMSDKTLRRALESLKARGIVEYTFNGRANCYTVNWEWEPDMGVPTPKRLQNGETGCKKQAREDDGWSVGPSSSERGTEQFGMSDLLYTRDVNKTSQQEIQRPAGAVRLPVSKKSANRSAAGLTESKKVLTADEVAAAHQQKMAGERAKRVAKAREKDHNGAFEESWKAAWVESFPSDPFVGWTGAQRGMINHARNRFSGSPVEFHDLLDFTVRQWNILRCTILKWMTNAPVTPKVDVFLRHLPDFASAFAESRLQAKSQFTKTEEETIAELVRHGGKTYEQAIAEVGERRGRALERRETNKVRQRAAREVEMAQEQRQQAAAVLAAVKRPQAAVPAAPVIVHEEDVPPDNDARLADIAKGIDEAINTPFTWE